MPAAFGEGWAVAISAVRRDPAGMPHMIVEYSSNIVEHHDIERLLDVIHETILELDVAPVPGVRIRGLRQEEFRIADGSAHLAYVAIVARFGPGRDAETKRRVIDSVLDAAEAAFAADDSPLVIAWSMEVQEIDADFRVNRNHIRAHLAGS